MMKNICQVISFLQAQEKLSELQFFGAEHIAGSFINEAYILAIAKKLDKKVIFQSIPGWHQFESGKIDILPLQLVNICFRDLEYQDEKFLIITMESYSSNKVFLVDFVNYVEFANNYEIFLGDNIEFVQPTDYIFMLLNQKIVVYINHEGIFTQIKFR